MLASTMPTVIRIAPDMLNRPILSSSIKYAVMAVKIGSVQNTSAPNVGDTLLKAIFWNRYAKNVPPTDITASMYQPMGAIWIISGSGSNISASGRHTAKQTAHCIMHSTSGSISALLRYLTLNISIIADAQEHNMAKMSPKQSESNLPPHIKNNPAAAIATGIINLYSNLVFNTNTLSTGTNTTASDIRKPLLVADVLSSATKPSTNAAAVNRLTIRQGLIALF